MSDIEEQKSLSGKRIGIFGKGGSGKSTLAVLLAKALSGEGYHVCLLDADSTNLGISRALGFERSPVPLLDYFGGMVFSGGEVTCPVDDPTRLPGAEITIDSLPAQYFVQRDKITLLVAGKIGDKGPGAGCDGPVSKIARDLRIYDGDIPTVTLVDFKAGFEDSARGAITSLDWAIMVVDPTLASIEMANELRQMVERVKADVLPATMHLENPEMVALANRIFVESNIKSVLFVLNKVKNSEVENHLRKELCVRNIEPMGVIHEHTSLSYAWLNGDPLDEIGVNQEARNIARVLDCIDAIEENDRVSI